MPNPTGARRIQTSLFRPIGITLLSFGFDPRKLLSLRYVPKYISQYLKFTRLGGSVTHRYPILSDYNSQAGSARGHYFHQDLLVASLIHESNPKRHVDIGSRVDGFVAHVASFRKIEVMDIRKLNNSSHQNISFLQADLMARDSVQQNAADSISCLHTIEHLGLGRYGDPLDPNGHMRGFNNLLRMLAIDGTLYISFPIGTENATHFNAHRVFHPKDILSWPTNGHKIRLVRFDYVDDDGKLHQQIDLKNEIINVQYGCGIYTFRKINNEGHSTRKS
jgi:hypothetical protein